MLFKGKILGKKHSRRKPSSWQKKKKERRLGGGRFETRIKRKTKTYVWWIAKRAFLLIVSNFLSKNSLYNSTSFQLLQFILHTLATTYSIDIPYTLASHTVYTYICMGIGSSDLNIVSTIWPRIRVYRQRYWQQVKKKKWREKLVRWNEKSRTERRKEFSDWNFLLPLPQPLLRLITNCFKSNKWSTPFFSSSAPAVLYGFSFNR